MNVADAISAALSRLGEPYQYGGDAARGHTDCSGLIQWAYGKAGLILPRVVDAQHRATPEVSGPVQAGDLLFFTENGVPDSHIAMAVSSSEMIEDPHTGASIRRVPIRSFQGHTRPAGAGAAPVDVAGLVGSSASSSGGSTSIAGSARKLIGSALFVLAGIALVVLGTSRAVASPRTHGAPA